MTADLSPNNIHLCCDVHVCVGGGGVGLHRVCEPAGSCCDDAAVLEPIWFRAPTETRGQRRHLGGRTSPGVPVLSFFTKCGPVDFLKRLLPVPVVQRRD